MNEQYLIIRIYVYTYMGNITFTMDDDLEEKLRNSIISRKGALGQALSEGAMLWIDKNFNKSSLDLRNSKKFRSKRR